VKNHQQLSDCLTAMSSYERREEVFGLIQHITDTNRELAIVNKNQGILPTDQQIDIVSLGDLRFKSGLSMFERNWILSMIKSRVAMSGLPQIEALHDVIETNETKQVEMHRLLQSTDDGDIAAMSLIVPTTSKFPTASDDTEIGEYDDGDIELPSYYGKGVTHLGKIVGARKLSRGYRFILNTGTEAKPPYKISQALNLARVWASRCMKVGGSSKDRQFL